MQIDLLPSTYAEAPRLTFVTLNLGGGPAMSAFVEAPVESNWCETVVRSLLAQPDEYFRPYFGGVIPSESEKRKYAEEAARRLTPARVFVNNIYRVELLNTPVPDDSFFHLCITRHDGQPCKEWRHLQQIKNEIAGPEYEAMEIFPAESRLVDTGNQYHLWVHKDPSFRFPVGWWLRLVRDHPVPLIRQAVDENDEQARVA